MFTKTDNQLDNYHEIVSMSNRLTKQNFCLKVIVLLFLIFVIFEIINRFI